MEKFKKEWNREDFTKVDRKIRAYFGGKSFKNHRGETVKMPVNKIGIENVLGLPYTSSSSCAMLSMDCNINLFWDALYHFDRVVIRETDNKVCLIVSDREENEKTIAI